MKKLTTLVLCLLMCLSLMACGKDKDNKNDQPNNSSANMANPWKEVTADEIYGYIGYQFGIPEDAKDIKYFWNESAGIAEMQFTIDGLNVTARAKKTDAFEDISGMNYDFSNNDDNYGHGPDCFIWNNDQELRGDYHLLSCDDGCVSLGLWYCVSTSGNYSLSLGYVSDAFSGMSQYASEVFILEKIEGDPAEYSQGYWEEKYPGENVCPFYIEENGIEYKYFCVSSYFDGTMQSWVASPFNWNGWHIADGNIVNKDETLKMTDDWAGEDPSESFSSFCTVTTEPYVPENGNTVMPDIETSEDGDIYTVKMGDNTEIIVNHKDNVITKMTCVVTYKTAEEAAAALAEYNMSPDADVESIKVEGNVLTCVYKDTVYAELTYSDMLVAFEMLKEMGGFDFNSLLQH